MRQDAIGVELWGAVVWLAVGLVAFFLPMFLAVTLTTPGPAAFETVFCLPLAVWLAVLTARALNTGGWVVFGGRAVTAGAEPVAFFAFTGVAVLIAGVFLAGFLRGLISLLAIA